MTVETTTSETVDRITHALIERGFNHGDFDGLAAVVAPDMIEHQEGATSGIEGLKALITELRTSFPDLHLELRTAPPRGTRPGSASARPAPTPVRSGAARRLVSRSTSPSWTSFASSTAAWSNTGASPIASRC